MSNTKEQDEDVKSGCALGIMTGIVGGSIGLILGVIEKGFWSGLLIGVGCAALGMIPGYYLGYYHSKKDQEKDV